MTFISGIKSGIPLMFFTANPPIFFLLLDITSDGVNEPFFIGCHSDANCGFAVAKSFTPTIAFFPAQYGHPLFALVLLLIKASHSCPFSHCHQTFLPLVAVTISGVSPLFLLKSHSLAISG